MSFSHLTSSPHEATPEIFASPSDKVLNLIGALNTGYGGPAYHKLTLAIKAAIDSNRLGSGSNLPSVREFSKIYGLSRTTATKALQRLQQDGLLICNPNNGTYTVINSQAPTESGQTGTQTIYSKHKVISDWQSKGSGPATASEMMHLNLGPGSKVKRFQNRQLQNEIFCAVEHICIPDIRARLTCADEVSFYQLLEVHDTRPVKFLLRIQSIILEKAVCALFGVAADTVCLLVERKGFTITGNVFEYRYSYYLSDHYDVFAELRH